MENPAITIGITAYREGELLRKSINAMQRQEYPGWEGIIVLDGGHDNVTRRIVESVSNPRIRVCICRENMGPYAAREYLFEQSKHDLILHCDGDDSLRPDAASTVAQLFENNSVSYAGFGMEMHYPDGRMRRISGHSTSLRKFIMEHDFPGYVIFRREIWEKFGRYNRRLLNGRADFEFYLKLLAANEPFAYTDKVIIDKTEREGSVQTSYLTRLGRVNEIIVEDNREAFLREGLLETFLARGYLYSAWACVEANLADKAREMALKYVTLEGGRAVWPLHLYFLPSPLVMLLARLRLRARNFRRSGFAAK